MTCPVKFKNHIESVWRTDPVMESRLGKTRLDKNERISPFPESFWRHAMEVVSQEQIQSYPEVWPLYKTLSEFHGLAADNFLVTAGSDAAIRHCFEVFVSPGDTVLYPDPTFAMVAVYGALFDANMKPVHYDGKLRLDVDYLIKGIDEKTSLVILANPNSPTGTYETNDQIVRILDRAAKYRVPVLIDEAYYGFCLNSAETLMGDYSNLLIARTFSKIAGMAGLRVGYAMGDLTVISLLKKFCPMYEVNAVGIVFAGKILENWEVAGEYGRKTIEGRKLLSLFFETRGFPVVNTETNFIHVNLGVAKKRILTALEHMGILVRGMLNVSGYEEYTRFSVGPWEQMLHVVAAIESALSEG